METPARKGLRPHRGVSTKTTHLGPRKQLLVGHHWVSKLVPRRQAELQQKGRVRWSLTPLLLPMATLRLPGLYLKRSVAAETQL